VAMLSSNYDKVTKFFVEHNINQNLSAIGSNISEGVLRSEFNNPANSLFEFAENYLNTYMAQLLEADEEELFNETNVTLTLYHFTNFGASPEVNIHVLESRVFKFYAFCNRIIIKKDWNRFLRNCYRNSKYKGATFNEANQTWESKKDTIEYETYKIWRNDVLEKLLTGKSILGNILKWNINHSFPFIIVEKYQTIIKNMDKKTIDKIRQIADFIVTNQSSDFISKSLKRLNGEKSPNGFRQFIVKLNGDNYKNEAEKPLVTVQDYADYLFPDGGNWREVRDILLIAIFEQLHATNVPIEVPEMQEEEILSDN